MPSDSLARAEASVELAVDSWPNATEALTATLDQLGNIDRAGLSLDDRTRLGNLREKVVILRARAKQSMTRYTGLEQLDATVGYTATGLEWARLL